MASPTELHQTAAPRYLRRRPSRRVVSAKPPARVHTVDTWIAFATVLGALAAAWIHLHNSSIWYDEAITLLTISGHAKLDWALGLGQFNPSADLGKIAAELYQQDVHPPLYFWTLAIWRTVFGGSLEVARSLSAVFTAGTLLLLYRFARDLPLRWPSIPVVVYALSAVGLRYAYNARPYAMASFLMVLTLFLAHRRSKWAGICAAACVATHYFAGLCVVLMLLFQCVREWHARKRARAIVVALSFLLGCAPLVPMLRVHISARPLQYPGFGPFYKELWALLKGSMEGVMPSTWLPHWGFALWIAAFFVAMGCWQVRKNADLLLLPFTYFGFLIGFMLLIMATNKSVAKMPADYYLGIAAPLLAILIGFGVSPLPRASPVLALALVAGTLTSVSMTKSPDYRRMSRQIRAECSHCPILVGVGYAGAIPACVLYEAKGITVLPVGASDTVGGIVQSIGHPAKAIFIPSNEPPTASIESAFLRTFPSVWKDGYCELDLSKATNRPTIFLPPPERAPAPRPARLHPQYSQTE